MGVGWLLSVQIVASAGTPRRGQCFTRLELVNGLGVPTSVGTILQGYVQDTTALAWPSSPIVSSIEGPGNLRAITGTDPAVGVNAITETVPTNARWRLISFTFSLTTDANVATRIVTLSLDDGATGYFTTGCKGSQAAGTTGTYQFHPGAAQVGDTTGPTIAGLPEGLVMPGGHRITAGAASFQVGDNFAAPRMLVEEWIED